MDHNSLRDTGVGVDLESGVLTSEGELSSILVSGSKRTLVSKLCGGLVDGLIKAEDGVSGCCGNVSSSNGVSPESVKVVGANKMLEGEEAAAGHLEKTPVKEKRKKTSNKKAPKPPRPPRGPSLDAADQKLVREISELAMLKRARIERMKAVKKMKAAKASSSSSNIFAMVFTVIFCLVIFFHGNILYFHPNVTYHNIIYYSSSFFFKPICNLCFCLYHIVLATIVFGKTTRDQLIQKSIKSILVD